MSTHGPRMPNDSRGNRPATDVIQSTTHNLDLRKFTHRPQFPVTVRQLRWAASLRRAPGFERAHTPRNHVQRFEALCIDVQCVEASRTNGGNRCMFRAPSGLD